MLKTAVQQFNQLLVRQTCNIQQKRTEVILRRMFPVESAKPGEKPILRKRHMVYIFDDNTNWKKIPDIEVILSQDVTGLGVQGDLVKVPRKLFRSNLLPRGLALYASPENLKIYEEYRKDKPDAPKQTSTGQMTVRQLKGMTLLVPMNQDVPWTLDKTHVRIAFRRLGVEVSEESISMPEEPISEPKQFTVEVMVNKMDKVPVKAIVYHYNKKDPSKHGLPEGMQFLPRVWTKTKVRIGDPSPSEDKSIEVKPARHLTLDLDLSSVVLCDLYFARKKTTTHIQHYIKWKGICARRKGNTKSYPVLVWCKTGRKH